MTPSNTCEQMYHQLIDINKKAFEQGFFEVAFHALAAAFHCACLLESQPLLQALEQTATEQRDWIDTSDSTQSVLLHGNRSIYTSLVAQIKTRKQMLHLPDL